MDNLKDNRPNSIAQSYMLVSPASTLLVATLVALILGLATQLASAKSSAASFGHVWVSDAAPPGGVIQIAIDGTPDERYTAYLPGLSNVRRSLRYDKKSGFHIGAIRVPPKAPKQGYCTVRVSNTASLEEDHKVALGVRLKSGK